MQSVSAGSGWWPTERRANRMASTTRSEPIRSVCCIVGRRNWTCRCSTGIPHDSRAGSTDLRQPRLRCQDERKIGFHVGIEGKVEPRERAQQVLLVTDAHVVAADEKFRRCDDVFAV